MTTFQMWGALLIAVALLTLGLQARRLSRGQLTMLQFIAGAVARFGFLFLGIVYVTDIVYRYRRAPLIGLFIVGMGIALNLVAGIIENVRRARMPAPPDEE